MAEEEALPGLSLARGEDAVRAWGRLPGGTAAAYVRFPRGGDLPLAAVQRLARRGSVIVDAGPRDANDVLDLAVAGAAGVVAWLADGPDVAAMVDAVGDGFLLGCTAKELAKAAELARMEGVALLVAEVEPPEGVHGYRVDFGAEPLVLRRFGAWPTHAEPEGDGAGEPGDAEEADGEEP